MAGRHHLPAGPRHRLRRHAERRWAAGGSGLYRSAAAGHRARRRTGATTALWLLGIGGLAVAGVGYLAAPAPPPVPTATALPVGRGGAAAPLPASVPTRVDIAAIDVHAPVETGGVDASGEVQVPPLTHPYLTTWYGLGAAPGEAGNAVILGHVDSRRVGPAVFYDLGRLRAGATVTVTRADGIVAVFRVDGVARYAKERFPVEAVYGPSDVPGLRLVTCGGAFDATRRTYDSSTVVAATLVSWHRGDAAAAPLRTFIPERPTPAATARGP